MDKYISIKVILDNILDHPLLKDVSLERAINHTINFIRIVGCPRMFTEKTEIIPIENYRGALPNDFDNIIQVRIKSKDDASYKVFVHTTDSFHMSNYKECSEELTYKIQGNIIYTSIKDGSIEVSYNSIPIDEEGFPLIPDNSSFTRALELYIKKQCFTVLFDLGKINSHVYNNVLQEYAWAVGQAQSDLVRPTIDQIQSLTNMWNKIFPDCNGHKRGFKN